MNRNKHVSPTVSPSRLRPMQAAQCLASTRARLAYVALRNLTPERAGKLAPELPATERLARINLSAHTLPIVAARLEFALLAIATFEAGVALSHARVLTAFRMRPSTCSPPCALPPFRRALRPRAGLFAEVPARSQAAVAARVLVHWHSAYSLFVFALFMTYATDFYSRGSIIAQYAAGLITIAIVRFADDPSCHARIADRNLRGKQVVVIGEAGRSSARPSGSCTARARAPRLSGSSSCA